MVNLVWCLQIKCKVIDMEENAACHILGIDCSTCRPVTYTQTNLPVGKGTN